MPGELTTCPGLQTMELPYSILDHASPWRLDELNNPKATFPEAYTIFESLNERASATEDESKCQRLLGILEVKREQLDLARKAGCNEITNGAKISSHRRWEMTKVNMSEVKVSFQFTLTIHTIEENGPDDFSEPGVGDIQINGWNTNINNVNIALRKIQLTSKWLSPHTSNLPSFDCCVFFVSLMFRRKQTSKPVCQLAQSRLTRCAVV